MGITQVTTSKGRFNDIENNLPHWLDSEIDQLVIVDYGCEDHTAARVAQSKYASDKRVYILRVPPRYAGPFFNVSAARNIGARLARHEWLMFVDADCRPQPAFWYKIQGLVNPTNGSDGPLADIIVSGSHVIDEDRVTHRLPLTFQQDGQCLVRAYIFHEINGYNELNPGWGGESYDLYLRAADYQRSSPMNHCRMAYFEPSCISMKNHPDSLREKYQPVRMSRARPRELIFSQRMRSMRRRRGLAYRAQPGRPFGIPELGVDEAMPRYPLFIGRSQTVFIPGEDF